MLDSQELRTEEALQRLEQIQIDELIPSHDAQEGLQAFLENAGPSGSTAKRRVRSSSR